ncbi:YaaL family protein [Oceanobacillus massiliensis]|uniref:YaaL family protein n=1 Tax=Oceanobacillus massiliensis TaxID=1465765 RepID=UPI000289526D|nr:YaaL family protein [Oceanobacillus massiliensis]
MGKRIKKTDVDSDLLDAIFVVEREWKQLQLIVAKSIEPTQSGIHQEALTRAKYLFLLREARHRKISAMRV